MKILGIDPGTTTVGYAIIEKIGQKISLLDYGVIETAPKLALEKKLVEIGSDISGLLELHKPERVGVEKLFFNTNITTGIAVSHARGVIIHEIAKRAITLHEYTPLQIKKAITSSGTAKKAQLQKAIQMIFGLSEIPKPDDAADAIGIAYMTGLERDINKDS
ncbi:crossover junction endodeoxyribonuclease RuvC [Candidatus Gracilibacteria bacterium]|nr:crossover junction endodeoxyribonuclease RuvC [Candidatus Gracilibacteria bacterium]